MYNEQIEQLISAALADGTLTEKEKQILFKKAQTMGIDLDEFEMVLDARLVELQKAEKEKAEKSAPKSDKYGAVRKCPACGAIVPAFHGICPDCGHEFTDVDANASSKKLSEALLKENSVSKQKQIIETFPLPNTKGDLLEFLTALKPRISDLNDPLNSSYFKKYQECIEKAKVSFPNDKLIAPFIAEHDGLVSKLKRETSKYNILLFIKKHWIWITAILAVLILVCVFYPTAKNDHKKCNQAIEKALSNNNIEKAAQYAYKFNGKKVHLSRHNVENIIRGFLAKDQISEAEKMYKYFEEELDWGSIAFVEYYLTKDDLENAEKYRSWSRGNFCFENYWLEKGKYPEAWEYSSKRKEDLKNYIERICKTQTKEKARKFLNLHIDEIKDLHVDRLFHSAEEDRKESEKKKKAILKELNNFINNY